MRRREAGARGDRRFRLVRVGGFHHLTKHIVRIADALENLNLDWSAAVQRKPGHEAVGVLQHVNRIPNREAAGGTPGRVHQVVNRVLVVVSLLEVKRDFRGQRERWRAEQRFEPLANQTMQLRTAHFGEPAVDRLAVQRMVEFVVGRYRPVGQLPHARCANEQPPFRESLAGTLDVVDVRGSGGHRPRGKAFSNCAGPPERTLFGVRELIEPNVEHVLEGSRDAWLDPVDRCGQPPGVLVAGDDSACH